MGHGSGERLLFVWPCVAMLTLLHLCCFSFEPHRCCAGVVFRLCLAMILWCMGSPLLLSSSFFYSSLWNVSATWAVCRAVHDLVARISWLIGTYVDLAAQKRILTNARSSPPLTSPGPLPTFPPPSINYTTLAP